MEGYEVFTAENGCTGLEQARLHLPDLILCDVLMPVMDGYSVVQTLRSEPALAAIPFIFLTARSARSDVRVGMNFGADDYLTKPVVRDELLAAVQVRLARAGTHERQLDAAAAKGGFHPDFSTHQPLVNAFAVIPREAEVLLRVAQGKNNGDVASILRLSGKPVKQHLGSVFQKIGVESRTAASLRAVEALSWHPALEGSPARPAQGVPDGAAGSPPGDGLPRPENEVNAPRPTNSRATA